MKMVKSVFLGIVSFVLWRIALTSTGNMQQYEQKFSSFKMMMDYYMLNWSSCVSVIFCSIWCTNDQDCVSFMFDAETSNCTTFSSLIVSESGDNMEVFYVKKGWHTTVIRDSNVAYNTSFVNVARGKRVVLSSRYGVQLYGGLMVDGNRSPELPCAHTRLEYNPYALIDLKQTYNVFSLYIVNRRTAAQRLHDLKILIGNVPNTLSVCIDYPEPLGTTSTFRVPIHCRGRYVKLQLFTREYLTLCEVEVYSIL